MYCEEQENKKQNIVINLKCNDFGHPIKESPTDKIIRDVKKDIQNGYYIWYKKEKIFVEYNHEQKLWINH